MRHGILLVAAALLAAVAPATRAADLPPIVVQLAPPGKVLDDIRSMANAVGGDKAVKQFNDALKEKLGEKGLSGIDLNRSAVIGLYFRGEGNAKDDSYGLGLAPYTDEKDFLALLKKGDAKITPVKGKKGRYKIEPDEDDQPDSYVEFKDGFAYVGINTKEGEFDPSKFPAYDKLVMPGERALLTARVYFDRLPKDAQEKMLAGLDEAIKKSGEMPLPPDAAEGVKQATELFGKAIRHYLTQLKDAQEAVFRVVYDPAATEAAIEVGLVGKPGSSLAKDIAARKDGTNRFASLIGKETTVGLLFGLPLSNPDVREGLAKSFEGGAEQGMANMPPQAAGTMKELVKGLARTFRSGEFDAALAVNGPNKANHYLVALGLSFDDPAALEKELRDLYKNAPGELKAILKLDAAKVGEQNVHVARIGPMLPPEAQGVFGEEAELCFTFAPKGIYVMFGTDSLAALKAAVAAKPDMARGLDIVLNPNRLEKLVSEAAGPQVGAKVSEMFGAEDKLSSAFFIGMKGGSELSIRIGLNLKILPRAGYLNSPGVAAPE